MFIKSLVISGRDGIVREIIFHLGLNLIVDNTPMTDGQTTGNNVGKTTVLKLIDFCLGGKSAIIYTDTENKKAIYGTVKDYLVDEEIAIKLSLVDDLNDNTSRQVIIERNFLPGKRVIRKINGVDILEKDFENELLSMLIPNQKAEKPSFRQIISHNIRYKDDSINNTLKTLDRYTTDVEYETLYLFLLGCSFEDGAKKQALVSKIKQEENFKDRLEKAQTKNAYEIALSMVEDEINLLNEKKAELGVDANFEDNLNQLNIIKYKINKASSNISNMSIRKNLIIEAKQDLEKGVFDNDLKQIRMLYNETTKYIENVQRTFDELVDYHNKMLIEKARFISADLPALIVKIDQEESLLDVLLRQEKELSIITAKSDSFTELEQVISALNDQYHKKGEYESIISQLDEVEENINDLTSEIGAIDTYLFSSEFEDLLMIQIKKFNKHFSFISNELYGEKYALKYDKITNKNNQQVYKFSAFNANMSSGKKQGEILCFDLAYIMFADEEQIPCLHFLLNDKKELMHSNQLNRVAAFIMNKDIQLVVSILKDKLPIELTNAANIVIELSQNDKLFRIEK